MSDEIAAHPSDLRAACDRLDRFVRLGKVLLTADAEGEEVMAGLDTVLGIIQHNVKQLAMLTEALPSVPERVLRQCEHMRDGSERFAWSISTDSAELRFCVICAGTALRVLRDLLPAVDDCEHMNRGLTSHGPPQHFFELPTRLGIVRRCVECTLVLWRDTGEWVTKAENVLPRWPPPERLSSREALNLSSAERAP